jgi:predicted alpha/beta-fold hydrolase
MNFRGCSGQINRLAKAYHSGISEDVEEVFSKLVQLYPDKEFVFVGYSLGANVLLKWLGESQSHPQVSKAIAVSTPFSLAFCSEAMLSGASQFYGKYFVRKLVIDFRRKLQHFDSIGEREQSQRIQSLGEFNNISTIWEFDDKITAPLHGFKDAEDYYNRCSSIGFVNAIETDTLLIQSQNDPLIPVPALPSQSTLSSNINLELSPEGGHVGFFSGLRDNWLERRILEFVQG